MNEGKAREQIARAQRAKAILEDPLLTEAFADIEAGAIRVWKNSKDLTEQQDARRLVLLLDKTRNHLAIVMQGGKIADADLIAIDKRRKLFG